MALIAQQAIDLVLMDMNFTIDSSGRQGMKLLQAMLAEQPQLPILLMTGWATVQLAVAGMKAGAKDFIAKPWDNKQLIQSIKDNIRLASLSDLAVPDTAFDRILTQSPRMLQLIRSAQRVAPTDASVLITGESGTGKELIAEAIHNSSPRATAPFVAVNLGGIPENLFESELFGHKAGAFTDAKTDRKGRFELAEGGTLFLDEIGDLPLANQVKLLRVLQERRYERLGESRSRSADVRIISATSRPLNSMIEKGEFREDLFYRINLIPLQLPPLRERAGDIPLLAKHFLQQAALRYQRAGLDFTASALDWLAQQSFPGNVRALQNLVDRSAILCTEILIEAEDLARYYNQPVSLRASTRSFNGQTLAEMEETWIKGAIQQHAGNISQAAAALGLTRAALYRRLEKYGIQPEAL